MKRFFFALTGTGDHSPDEIGAEFSSLEAAYIEGCRAALEMSLDMLRGRVDPSDLRFEISDARGTVLIDLPFAEVLKPAAKMRLPHEPSSALLRFRAHTAEHRRISAELATIMALTTNTLETTRAILARSRRRSPWTPAASVDAP